MTVTKWTLTGPAGVHTFAINPSDKNGPAGEVDTELGVGETFVDAVGQPMISVLQTKAQTGKFHVVVLAAAEYKALWSWWFYGDTVTLADDLGATSSVYLTDIEGKRDRKPNDPWYHELTVSYLVLPA